MGKKKHIKHCLRVEHIFYYSFKVKKSNAKAHLYTTTFITVCTMHRYNKDHQHHFPNKLALARFGSRHKKRFRHVGVS
jgi:hypothetical protein